MNPMEKQNTHDEVKIMNEWGMTHQIAFVEIE